MEVAVGARAAGGHATVSFGEPAGSPSIDPSATDFADDGVGHAGIRFNWWNLE
jgi:hypothetical protein